MYVAMPSLNHSSLHLVTCDSPGLPSQSLLNCWASSNFNLSNCLMLVQSVFSNLCALKNQSIVYFEVFIIFFVRIEK